MSQATRLLALTNAIGADIKALQAARGDLNALTTVEKGSLVAAINEVAAIANAGTDPITLINDTAGDGVVDKTWSADKIGDYVALAVSNLRAALLGPGVSAAYDTLRELQDLIQADASSGAAMATAIANRVRFDDAQVLTDPQKVQVNANIGGLSLVQSGDPEQDLVAAYVAAKL